MSLSHADDKTEQPQFHIYHLPQSWLFVLLFGVTSFVLLIVRQVAGSLISTIENLDTPLFIAYLAAAFLFLIIGFQKFRRRTRLLLVYADKCRLILPYGGNGFEWKLSSMKEVSLAARKGWRRWLPPLEATVTLEVKGRIIPVLIAQKIYRIKALKLQLMRLSAMGNVSFYEQLYGAKERRRLAGPNE